MHGEGFHMIKCFTRIKAYVEEAGLNIPVDRLREFAFQLEQQRAGSLTGAEFAQKANVLIQEHLERLFAKNRLAKAMYLAQREATLEKVLDRSYGATVAENFRSWIEGGALRPGDSTNIDPMRLRHAVEGDLLRTFRRGMEPLKEVADNGAIDREVFQELWAIDQVEPLGGSGSSMAVEMAKVIQATNNQIFSLKKAYNPYMERTTEYLMKRMWSRERVGTASKADWVADMMQAAGDRSFPELSTPEKELVFQSIYDRIKDGRYGSVSDDAESDRFITIKGPGGNIMKAQARARSIVMNDWQTAFDMNLKYGYGTVGETMDSVIRGAARDISQLQKFTANPRAFYETTYARALARAPEAEKVGLKDAKETLDRSFRTAMGDFDVPARTIEAKIGKGLATIEFAAKTGTSLIRSQLDLANAAMLMHEYNGKNLAQNAAELFAAYSTRMTKSVAELGGTTHLNEELERLYMFSNATRGALMERLGSPSEAPGGMAKLSQLQGRLSGMQAHVDSLRAGIGAIVAHDAAQVSHLSHGELTPQWQQFMLRYGIDEHEWNALRHGTVNWTEGEEVVPSTRRKLLDADGVEAIPDEVVSDYLTRSGKSAGEPSDESIFLARKQLSYLWGTLINDVADQGVAHGGTRQRSILLQGTTINTMGGLTLRLATQFKTAAMVQMDIVRRGFASGVDASGMPRGDWAGTAQHVALLAFIGALGLYARDAIQGKTPEDPRSLNFAARTLVASGAGGILGDTLVSMLSKDKIDDMKMEAFKAAAGPVFGDALQAAAVAGTAAKASATGKKQPTKEATKLALGLIPGQNLFWSTAAFNYYFANGLKEFMGPGFLGSLERHTTTSPGLLEDRQRYFMAKPTGSYQWPKALGF